MSRGIAEGALKKADPLFLAIALQGLTKGYMVRRLFERGDSIDEEDVEKLHSLFMKGASS
jgi:hypothetical protein